VKSCSENLVRFGTVYPEICWRTDRQTDTHHNTPLPYRSLSNFTRQPHSNVTRGLTPLLRGTTGRVRSKTTPDDVTCKGCRVGVCATALPMMVVFQEAVVQRNSAKTLQNRNRNSLKQKRNRKIVNGRRRHSYPSNKIRLYLIMTCVLRVHGLLFELELRSSPDSSSTCLIIGTRQRRRRNT